jgi:hypothetical protein
MPAHFHRPADRREQNLSLETGHLCTTAAAGLFVDDFIELDSISPPKSGTTAPDSGWTDTTLGGSLSGGPPGGGCTLAQASATPPIAAAATSSRAT